MTADDSLKLSMRFIFKINECDDIRFNQGAMFYRGIDQNGMCFFSQEDDPVQSKPSISQLSKPKESIETHIQDDGPVSNRKFLIPVRFGTVRLSMFFLRSMTTQFIENL